MTFTWTPEAIESASQAFSSGVPASAIAADLGISRNAVIGKMHREGVKTPRTKADNQPPKPRAPRVKTVASPKPAKTPEAPQKPVERVEYIPDPMHQPEPALRLVSHGKTIVNLLPRECRWPVSETPSGTHLFCAAPTARGDSYCAHCSPLAYTATKPRIGQNPTAGRRFA